MTADTKLLERIRNLLAKAESTEFAPEAEALTAKAMDLMHQHSISVAMLEQAADITATPLSRHVLIEGPYAMAKASLASSVAGSFRCRFVAISTGASVEGVVMGFPADLDLFEMLFTSLLVQCTSAMLAEPGTQTRAFRQAFILGFTLRVAQRLEERKRAVEEAFEQHAATDPYDEPDYIDDEDEEKLEHELHDDEDEESYDDAPESSAEEPALPAGEQVRYLPAILDEREQLVDDAVAEEFPQIKTRTVSGSDLNGNVRGRRAGDRADLGDPALSNTPATSALEA